MESEWKIARKWLSKVSRTIVFELGWTASRRVSTRIELWCAATTFEMIHLNRSPSKKWKYFVHQSSNFEFQRCSSNWIWEKNIILFLSLTSRGWKYFSWLLFIWQQKKQIRLLASVKRFNNSIRIAVCVGCYCLTLGTDFGVSLPVLRSMISGMIAVGSPEVIIIFLYLLLYHYWYLYYIHSWTIQLCSVS